MSRSHKKEDKTKTLSNIKKPRASRRKIKPANAPLLHAYKERMLNS